MADTPEIEPIENVDLTEGTLNGNGTFDVMMQSITEHIALQFDKNRIKGVDYANVYLGSMQTAMGQAVQFQLQRQVSANQAALILAQKELVELEKEKLALEAQLVAKQIEKMDEEIIAIRQQVSLSEQQELNVIEERQRIIAETANSKQTLTNLISENTKINSEKNRIDADTLLTQENTANAVVQRSVLTQQKEKLEADTRLSNYKVNTERSQTYDTVYSYNTQGDVTGATPVTGVVGKQKDLYTAQKEGFARDAEQKLTKILVDSWSVRNSGDPAGNSANSVNKLFDDTIGEAVNISMDGIK